MSETTTVINIAHVKRLKGKPSLLLVLKKDVWILPGGKVQEGDSSDIACLLREIKEELPSAKVDESSLQHYGDFEGTTPHTLKPVFVKVYFGKLRGDIRPAQEITDSGYFSRNDFADMIISPISWKIIEHLIKEKRF